MVKKPALIQTHPPSPASPSPRSQKTVYAIGDSLDTAGMTVTATYSDGSKKTVTAGYTVNGFSSTTIGTKTVTVTFEGKTAKFTVTVTGDITKWTAVANSTFGDTSIRGIAYGNGRFVAGGDGGKMAYCDW